MLPTLRFFPCESDPPLLRLAASAESTATCTYRQRGSEGYPAVSTHATRWQHTTPGNQHACENVAANITRQSIRMRKCGRVAEAKKKKKNRTEVRVRAITLRQGSQCAQCEDSRGAFNSARRDSSTHRPSLCHRTRYTPSNALPGHTQATLRNVHSVRYSAKRHHQRSFTDIYGPHEQALPNYSKPY